MFYDVFGSTTTLSYYEYTVQCSRKADTYVTPMTFGWTAVNDFPGSRVRGSVMVIVNLTSAILSGIARSNSFMIRKQLCEVHAPQSYAYNFVHSAATNGPFENNYEHLPTFRWCNSVSSPSFLSRHRRKMIANHPRIHFDLPAQWKNHWNLSFPCIK